MCADLKGRLVGRWGEGEEICILRAWNDKAESSLSIAPESLIHRCTISKISNRPLYLKTTSSLGRQSGTGVIPAA